MLSYEISQMFKKEQLLKFVEFDEYSAATDASFACAKLLLEAWEPEDKDNEYNATELIENIEQCITKLRRWKLYVEGQAKLAPSKCLSKDSFSANNWSEDYPLVHIFNSIEPLRITGNSCGLVSLTTAVIDAISEIGQGRTELMQSDGMAFEVVVTREDSDTTWESISSP